MRPVHWLLVAFVLAIACRPEIVPEPYIPSDAHDAYRHALTESGLSDTALGRDWAVASEASLRSPVEVTPPLKETFYVDPAEAFSVGYRFAVTRGQRTEITLALHPEQDWRLFLDLFRVSQESGEAPVHVASASEGDMRLAFEPRRDGEYVLRLSSELLRGGNGTLTIENVASLDFPVRDHDTGAIGSVFGAPREGGRRSHHGVDIFARRHTEVLAPTRARVRRVAEWKLGGNVVWLEDPERNLRLYFAHLQTQDVSEGVWVAPGDRIGTVGNSGNARTTPPHLHFGIYVRGEGPIDPLPFLAQPRRSPAPVRVTLERIGGWVRSGSDDSTLYIRARGREALLEVPPHTPLQVSGGAERRFRVELPNGIVGYISERATEPLDEPLSTVELSRAAALLDRPRLDAAVRLRVDAGRSLPVLARFDRFLWVAAGEGSELVPAWIPEPEPVAATAGP